MNPSEADPPPPDSPAETMTAPFREPRTVAERPGDSEALTTMNLEVVGGPMDGVTASAARNDLVIGRGPKNDLSLRLDPMVSNTHARIVRDGSSYWLEDLESRNGTYVGEQRIHGRTLIGPGTLFVLGSTCVEFLPN